MRVYILVHSEGSESSGTWSDNVAVFGSDKEADANALCAYLCECREFCTNRQPNMWAD
jgi:hypothetical protein